MEKSGNTFRGGDKTSASARTEKVADILNKSDSQQYRKLIAESLKETKSADED